ncbi:MAG: pilus assembly protein PilM [Candidatus Muiribacteriaceae bacterium]
MKIFTNKSRNIILDIGTRYTKAIHLSEKSTEQMRIDHSIEESTYDFDFLPLQECKVKDEEKFLEVLRLCYSKLRTMEKNVFVTIPDHVVIIRLITLKEEDIEKGGGDSRVKEIVVKKLKPTLPISIDRWFYDVQEVERTNAQRIFLVEAILRNNLFEIERQVRRIGLNPVGVDINSFNSVNLFSEYLESEDNTGRNISVVSLNNRSTTVMVFRNGHLRTAQTRLVGGYDIIRHLSEAHSINATDAEKIMREQTIFLPENTEEQDNINNFNIIKPVFSELLMSLFNMYEYYTENFKESEINKIILTGGLSNMKNLDKQLEARLNIDVIKGDSLVEVFNRKGERLSRQDINTLAASAGSLLRE